MDIQLYNTLSGNKEQFTPADENNVTMYVCGPTVYARPHIGNARSTVVYDMLYRLLCYKYGTDNVVYVRNITDVDDKINTAAIKEGITIQALTARVTGWFHDDMTALGCLRPNVEPKATEHIDGMISMIKRLISKGNAYVGSDGKHVLFNVTSDSENTHWRYGMLSGRTLDDQQAGARIAVESYKKHPGDFVLWKPADDADDESSKFNSPWGVGRPGWHIECSVMSTQYLGESFDIHGGGADLKFPHHENEIAQSCCAHPKSQYARYWVHNGFLTVEGEKMSKSLGNFITVHDLLEQGVQGEVIRLALLMSKYNEPLDWSTKKVEEAKKLLDQLYRVKQHFETMPLIEETDFMRRIIDDFYYNLSNDLNTPLAFGFLNSMDKKISLAEAALSYNIADDDKRHTISVYCTVKIAQSMGFLNEESETWFKGTSSQDDTANIESYIAARKSAKEAKDYAEADRIRDALAVEGIILEDKPSGETIWRRV